MIDYLHVASIYLMHRWQVHRTTLDKAKKIIPNFLLSAKLDLRVTKLKI
jgi:hypothetical protein